MARVTSFADKLKKKKGSEKINVKVIKWYRCEDRGTYRTLERIIRVDDINKVDKIDIIK